MAIFSTSPEWYGSDGTLKNIDTEISKITSGETVAGKAEKIRVLGNYASILDAVYPIGSIYMSVSPTNPEDLFGGTWEAWGTGRVPVGVNAADKDFKSVEQEGGTKEAELPWHNHGLFSGSIGLFGVDGFVGGDASSLQPSDPHDSENGYLFTISRSDDKNTAINRANTSPAGKSAASNLQPYITCYMWKRTE